MRNRNGVDPDRSGCGKKLERKQGRENIIMVYYVGKKKSIFNENKESQCLTVVFFKFQCKISFNLNYAMWAF